MNPDIVEVVDRHLTLPSQIDGRLDKNFAQTLYEVSWALNNIANAIRGLPGWSQFSGDVQ